MGWILLGGLSGFLLAMILLVTGAWTASWLAVVGICVPGGIFAAYLLAAILSDPWSLLR